MILNKIKMNNEFENMSEIDMQEQLPPSIIELLRKAYHAGVCDGITIKQIEENKNRNFDMWYNSITQCGVGKKNLGV